MKPVLFSSPHTDHLGVVGGGPVGLLLAWVLAQSGQRITLFEQRRMPFWDASDHRVLLLTHGSRLLLEQWGLWSACAAHAQPVRRVHLSDARYRGRLRLEAQACRLPALAYGVPWVRCMQGWWEAVQDAGVEVRDGVPLERVQSQGAGYQAMGQQLDGLLLAEGGHGTLARDVGYPPWPAHEAGCAQVWHVAWPGFPCDTAFQRMTEDPTWGVVPAGEDRAVVVRTGNAPVDALTCAQLHRIMGRFLPIPQTVHEPVSYPVRVHTPCVRSLGCSALVGQAAHALLPVGAQGLNLGLRDVAVLWRVWTADARSDTLAERLARYAAQRASDIRTTQRFTQSLRTARWGVARSAVWYGMQWLSPMHAAWVRWGAHLQAVHDIL